MSPKRKVILENDQVYHIFTRSIAKFVVLNDDHELDRMQQLCNYYRYKNFSYKYSQFLELSVPNQTSIAENLKAENDLLVEIISYCLMPTHIHLVLKQISDEGIPKYISRVLNGYSRFFNTKHQRIGPLWSGRFKSVLVTSDEQLLHLTRYIHLNPTSAGIVGKPNLWKYSSYPEYLQEDESLNSICNYHDLIRIPSKQYKKFVEDHKDYQRQLSLIKSITIDDYSG